MPNKYKLNANSKKIKYLCSKDKRLAKVISMVGPISYNLYTDGYSFLVHEIIEQMLSKNAGQRIYERLESLCDGNVIPETVSKLTPEMISNCGTSKAKASYIQSLTEAVLNGSIDFECMQGLSDKEILSQLTQLHGIGTWTAKMYLIFVLGHDDVLPYEDGAFLQSYKWMYKTNEISVASIEKHCIKWKPYSSIASRYLYKALDNGLTKNQFHLYK